MSDNILKPNTSLSDLESTLALVSLKLAQLHSKIEAHRGEDFLSPKEKILFYELYQIINRNFIDDSDDNSLGKLYSDNEIKRLKILSVYYSF